MPEMAAAAAAAFAQIERMVLIDAGNGADGNGGDTLSRLAGLVPVVVAQAIETVRATSGVDLTTLMNKSGSESTSKPAVRAEPTTNVVTPTSS